MDMEKRMTFMDVHGDPEIQRMRELLTSRILDSDMDSEGGTIHPDGKIRMNNHCINPNETKPERANRCVSC